ncbi:hypothetical protein N656DRAFT_270970 [Canariomyces notabilis]|uniref:Uncharacterized protein n=1 Tax=Canariomyces notabilis TaxID=2074819 RepID=A0AAN6YWK8_9PEZI|nr:hypothetical protein N656DRAFT_270970 [Canariomyces arenarius]
MSRRKIGGEIIFNNIAAVCDLRIGCACSDQVTPKSSWRLKAWVAAHIEELDLFRGKCHAAKGGFGRGSNWAPATLANQVSTPRLTWGWSAGCCMICHGHCMSLSNVEVAFRYPRDTNQGGCQNSQIRHTLAVLAVKIKIQFIHGSRPSPISSGLTIISMISYVLFRDAVSSPWMCLV